MLKLMKKGSKHSKETISLISKNRKGISSFKGKHHTQETKNKISLIKKSQHIIPKTAFKKGFKPWNFGIKGSIKAWNKGKHLSAETKEKISKKLKGIKLNIFTRSKMSISQKKRWSNPVEKERMLRKFAEALKLYDTEIERITKQELIKRKIKFFDQYYILGSIVDFYLPDYNIVLYCDGDYWHSREEVISRDKYFNKKLEKAGYLVVRFKESDIKNNINKLISKII